MKQDRYTEECAARAAGCVCIEPARHERRKVPHRCCCGGVWRGNYGDESFQIVELPGG